jgi:ankyrin repeat protein
VSLLGTCRGKSEVVQALCKLGADVEQYDKCGRALLMRAVDSKSFEVARYLLGQGAIVSSDVVAVALRREADADFTGLPQARILHD